MVGELPLDDGAVVLSKGKTLGYLAQHQELSSGNSIYEEVRTAKSALIDMEERILEGPVFYNDVLPECFADSLTCEYHLDAVFQQLA